MTTTTTTTTTTTPMSTPTSTTTPDPTTPTTTPGPCCWFWKYNGICEPPRPPCRFRHDVIDDGVTPCCFGATCRNGHKKRVTSLQSYNPTTHFDSYKNAKIKNVIGKSPAVRDATLLRSQLEPWSTTVLRERLALFLEKEEEQRKSDTSNSSEGETTTSTTTNSTSTDILKSLDGVSRGVIMQQLLDCYSKLSPRKVIQVKGTPVDPTLCDALLRELKKWRRQHTVNTRPSIHAESYMILRHAKDFEFETNNNNDNNNNDDGNKDNTINDDNTNTINTSTMSHKAQLAYKKLTQYQTLFDLAERALRETINDDNDDNDDNNNNSTFDFTALAVTYNFKGSPHIDKQNTGPFYGLSLGNFTAGGGGVCVEVDPWTVAHCWTRHQLSKVDGRYPHWVAPYKVDDKNNDNNNEIETNSLDDDDNNDDDDDDNGRYSLIYYSTRNKYQPPGPAYFGNVVVD